MPVKKYIVTLTKTERVTLNEVLNKGKHSAEKRKRAQALLLAAQNLTDDMIADRTGLSRRGLEQLRQRFVEDGFEVTIKNPRGRAAGYFYLPAWTGLPAFPKRYAQFILVPESSFVSFI